MNTHHAPLLVVESPRSARVLQARLGAPWRVLGTGGHIMRAGPRGWLPMAGQRRTVAALREAGVSASLVYVATDDDREGEGIAGQVATALSGVAATLKRALTPEILSDGALEAALEAAIPLDPSVGEGARVRHLIDGALTASLSGGVARRGITVGRVQAAALGRLCFGEGAGWGEGIAEGSGLLTTADLWRLAGERGVGLRQIIRVAQRLYQRGLISYPRTRSRWLPERARGQVGVWLSSLGPVRAAPPPMAQAGAHGALRPVSPEACPPAQVASRLPEEEARVYRWIWQAYVDAWVAPTHPLASARAAPAPSRPGERLDATLAAELLRHGVGTPASLAGALDGLLEQGLVWRLPGGPLKISTEGSRAVERLRQVCSAALTPALTQALDAEPVAARAGPPEAIAAALLSASGPTLSRPVQAACDESPRCPDCGGEMAIRRGRHGRFWGCVRFPGCRGTSPLEGDARRDPQTEREAVTCPACGEGRLRPHRGRTGRWTYRCDRHPECDFFSTRRPVALQCPHCSNPYLVEPEAAPTRVGRFAVRRGPGPGTTIPGSHWICPACGRPVERDREDVRQERHGRQ